MAAIRNLAVLPLPDIEDVRERLLVLRQAASSALSENSNAAGPLNAALGGKPDAQDYACSVYAISV
jgi:hypothetical protein